MEQFEIYLGGAWYVIEFFGWNEKKKLYYGLIRFETQITHPNLICNQHTNYMWGSDIAEYESIVTPEKDTIRCKRWKIAESVVI